MHYPQAPRVGRDNQMYDENSIRQISGTIAVDPRTDRVLVISSSKRKNVWVLPKGGWENDETREEAAKREAFEEGGVQGELTGFTGRFVDYDADGDPKGHVWFYELCVERVYDQWPEDDFRQRRWCTLEEAIQLLSFKPFMQKALLASSFGQRAS
ncbi:NUDIX hydrolase domain-like protein [Sporodiniella umbellata]|nr:NUDIX hydrolase domain-like protein [Sporodiniella umbellata]